MRKPLIWLLSITLIATIAAWWLDLSSSQIGEPKVGHLPTHKNQVPHSSIEMAPSTSLPASNSLVSLILRPNLPPARNDIFATVLPAQPPIPKEVPLLPLAPIVESAPPPNVRLLGSFSDPQGNLTLYLTQGDSELEAKVGQLLPNGYLVESATAQEVSLVYPRLGTKVIVPVASDQ